MSKRPLSSVTDAEMKLCCEALQDLTLREIIKEKNCEEKLPPGTGKIIGLRVKAEIPKRQHAKEDQQGNTSGVNTYTLEEQKVVGKHINIRVAELSLEEINSEIALGKIEKPIFTKTSLFGPDRINCIKLQDNHVTRTFVHPLLGIIKPNDSEQYRPKQTMRTNEEKDLIMHSILEMLKVCYDIIDHTNIDFDIPQYKLLGISAESKGIFHRILFILSQILIYRGKTIDQIFEEFELSPPTNSDVYNQFTAKEKNDKDWPKIFNCFEVNGRRCSGSTPIYFGKHLKQKREEVEKHYRENPDMNG